MQLTIKKEIEETVNLELPIFFKKAKEQRYRGLLNEDQYIEFWTTKTFSSYYNGTISFHRLDVTEAIGSWEAISEEAFIDAHEDFLRLQSLQPVLITHNHDDLDDVL